MNIKNIKGLKYPDEYFIKFFFKYQYHNKNNLKFFELGCSNGCNLMLPFSFDNDVVGIDLNENLIDYANENFKSMVKENYKFYKDDMREFCKNTKDIKSDVLIMANSIYYVPKNDFIQLLNNIKNNRLIKENSTIFIRFRSPKDFRNNKGNYIDENTFLIYNGITGEDGILCKFYEEYEMIQILRETLDLRYFQSMKIEYENIQNNTKVNNNDIVIWGTIN